MRDGEVFDWAFKGVWLTKMRSCPMCLGVWTTVAVALAAKVYNPWCMLTIAGLGHVLFLLRDKYLPCDKCTIPPAVPFKFTSAS